MRRRTQLWLLVVRMDMQTTTTLLPLRLQTTELRQDIPIQLQLRLPQDFQEQARGIKGLPMEEQISGIKDQPTAELHILELFTAELHIPELFTAERRSLELRGQAKDGTDQTWQTGQRRRAGQGGSPTSRSCST